MKSLELQLAVLRAEIKHLGEPTAPYILRELRKSRIGVSPVETPALLDRFAPVSQAGRLCYLPKPTFRNSLILGDLEGVLAGVSDSTEEEIEAAEYRVKWDGEKSTALTESKSARN
jgi:hypothetical protein